MMQAQRMDNEPLVVGAYCWSCRQDIEAEPAATIFGVLDSATVVVDVDVLCPVCNGTCMAGRTTMTLGGGSRD